MKRFIVTTLLLIIAMPLVVSAQYKKSKNIFVSNGRFTGFRAGVCSFPNKFVKPASTLTFTMGKQAEGRRFWYWFDAEYLFGSKFSYVTSDRDSYTGPVYVDGKTTGVFLLRFQVNYNLLKDEDGNRKVMPFVSLGTEFSRGVREDEITSYSPSFATPVSRFGSIIIVLGAGAGAGVRVKLSNAIRLIATGGYKLVAGKLEEGYQSTTPSHIYGSVGFVFTRNAKE